MHELVRCAAIRPYRLAQLDGFGSQVQQAVMPIVAKYGDQLEPIGTGFVITSNGLMMTARHVLHTILPPTRYRPAGPTTVSPDAELFAVWASDQKNPEGTYIGGLLPIDKAWTREDSDIGLCWLRLPNLENGPLKLPQLELSPGVPRVQDKVVGFGYHMMSGAVLDQSENKMSHEYKHLTAVSEGVVAEVHNPRRDMGLLSFPCFRTTAHFAHGMSGGPVFNATGSVCGVIASGSTFQDDSYASLVWFGLACHVEMASSEGAAVERLSLYELAQRGAIAVDQTFSHVRVTLGPDGSGLASIWEPAGPEPA